MPSFFLVRTLLDHEDRARRNLQARSFDVYLPMTRQVRRGKTFERPFLAGSLFVADDGRGIDLIRHTPGVTSVVHKDGVPLRLPQRRINTLMKREDDDGYVVLIGTDPGLFKPMQTVTRTLVFIAAQLQPSLFEYA